MTEDADADESLEEVAAPESQEPASPQVADPPPPMGTPTREPGHGGYAVPPKWGL